MLTDETQPAQLTLAPEGFFSVQVDKDLASKIAKGCGLLTETVERMMLEDNEARRLEAESQTGPNSGLEQVNIDPAFDEDCDTDEEEV